MAMMHINSEEFQQRVGGEAPVLVEFMAPWCVYCRRIAPALAKVAEQYGDRLFIGQVNIDDQPALAQQEQIEVVPTFVLYRGGQVLGSMTAPQSKAEIEAFLNDHLNQ